MGRQILNHRYNHWNSASKSPEVSADLNPKYTESIWRRKLKIISDFKLEMLVCSEIGTLNSILILCNKLICILFLGIVYVIRRYRFGLKSRIHDTDLGSDCYINFFLYLI